MARIAVERRLYEIALLSPKVEGPARQFGIGRYCSLLVATTVITKFESKHIERFADKASKIVHGSATTNMHARKLISQAAWLLSKLEGRAS